VFADERAAANRAAAQALLVDLAAAVARDRQVTLLNQRRRALWRAARRAGRAVVARYNTAFSASCVADDALLVDLAAAAARDRQVALLNQRRRALWRAARRVGRAVVARCNKAFSASCVEDDRRGVANEGLGLASAVEDAPVTPPVSAQLSMSVSSSVNVPPEVETTEADMSVALKPVAVRVLPADLAVGDKEEDIEGAQLVEDHQATELRLETLLQNELKWENVASRLRRNPRQGGADGQISRVVNKTYGQSAIAAKLGGKLTDVLRDIWSQAMYLVPVPALGKCFYASVSMSLYGTFRHQAEIRRATVRHMWDNEEQYSREILAWAAGLQGSGETLPSHVVDNDRALLQWYMQRAARPSEDAREPEIQAVAELNNLEIRIYRMGGKDRVEWVHSVGSQANRTRHCQLLLTSGHYDVMLANNGDALATPSASSRQCTAPWGPAGLIDKTSLASEVRKGLQRHGEDVQRSLMRGGDSSPDSGQHNDSDSGGICEDEMAPYSPADDCSSAGSTVEDHSISNQGGCGVLGKSAANATVSNAGRPRLPRAAKSEPGRGELAVPVTSGLGSAATGRLIAAPLAVASHEEHMDAARQVRFMNLVAYGRSYTDGGSKEIYDKRSKSKRRVATYGVHSLVLLNGKSSVYELQGIVRTDCRDAQLHCDIAEFNAAKRSVWLAARLGATHWDIITDSEIFVRAYRDEVVLHKKELIEVMNEIWQCAAEAKMVVTVEWVKGHAKNEGNIRADALATEARVKNISESTKGPSPCPRITPPQRAMLVCSTGVQIRA